MFELLDSKDAKIQKMKTTTEKILVIYDYNF